MKSFLSVAVLFLLLIYTQCKTITPLSDNPHDEVTAILVEATNQRSTRTNIELLLRQKRVSEWVYRNMGSTEEIEARYASIDPREAERIREQLTSIAGVIRVEIKKNGLPAQPVR